MKRLERLDVSVETEGRRTVVRVRGEVDMVTAESLGVALDRAVSAGAPWVEVDLAQVPFMDCSGLRVLFRAKRRLRDRGGTLTLSTPSAQVERLLSAAGLNHRLDASWPPAHGLVTPGHAALS
ncbi:STAS domain-containing protein [Streptosporangium sp. NPDC000396]|uniref:STAS domain-containing protein n=1 Tax=Streptosporangium sp. NPDC000396 TaxID=3366185 RepID=UPI0036ACAB8F